MSFKFLNLIERKILLGMYYILTEKSSPILENNIVIFIWWHWHSMDVFSNSVRLLLFNSTFYVRLQFEKLRGRDCSHYVIRQNPVTPFRLIIFKCGIKTSDFFLPIGIGTSINSFGKNSFKIANWEFSVNLLVNVLI